MIKHIYTKATLAKGIVIEFDSYLDTSQILAVVMDIRSNQPHSGVFNSISLLGLTLCLNIYSTKHD